MDAKIFNHSSIIQKEFENFFHKKPSAGNEYPYTVAKKLCNTSHAQNFLDQLSSSENINTNGIKKQEIKNWANKYLKEIHNSDIEKIAFQLLSHRSHELELGSYEYLTSQGKSSVIRPTLKSKNYSKNFKSSKDYNDMLNEMASDFNNLREKLSNEKLSIVLRAMLGEENDLSSDKTITDFRKKYEEHLSDPILKRFFEVHIRHLETEKWPLGYEPEKEEQIR